MFHHLLWSPFLSFSLVDNTSMLSCLRAFVPSSIGVSMRTPIRLSIRSFLRALRPFVPMWLGPLHLWSFRIYSSSIIYPTTLISLVEYLLFKPYDQNVHLQCVARTQINLSAEELTLIDHRKCNCQWWFITLIGGLYPTEIRKIITQKDWYQVRKRLSRDLELDFY